MPNRITILRWMNEFPEFDAAIARARVLFSDAHADDIIELVNMMGRGEIPVKAANAAINAKKWLAQVGNPSRFLPPQAGAGGAGDADTIASDLKALAARLPG